MTLFPSIPELLPCLLSGSILEPSGLLTEEDGTAVPSVTRVEVRRRRNVAGASSLFEDQFPDPCRIGAVDETEDSRRAHGRGSGWLGVRTLERPCSLGGPYTSRAQY